MKQRMLLLPFRPYVPVLLGAAAILGLVSCSPDSNKGGAPGADGSSAGPKPTIQNKGSDTMIELAQAWAEKYHDANVEVSGGGTGVGISSLITGTVDIANASRALSADEIAKAKQNTGKDPVLHTVGYDALAVYVHKDNPLSEITLEQIKQIYSQDGTIKRWSDLGLKVPGCEGDDKIVVVSRQNNSGTYEYFKEAILGRDGKYTLSTIDQSGSRDLVTLVGKTPCAIGYSGMGYKTPNVKFLKVKGKTGDGVLPSVGAVHDKTYPISRPLYMYTVGEGADHMVKYIDWVRSDVGQKICGDIGYVPLQEAERSGRTGPAPSKKP